MVVVGILVDGEVALDSALDGMPGVRLDDGDSEPGLAGIPVAGTPGTSADGASGKNAPVLRGAA